MKLTLPERFLLVRRRMGMTQTRLGAMLNVSRRTITRIERGEGTVGESKLRSIVARFEMLEQRQAGK